MPVRTLAPLALAAALAASHASAATLTLSPDGSTIYLTGEIERADAARFNLAKDASGARFVEIDSADGAPLAGLAIGMKVRETGMKVLIRNGKACAGACGLVWASARQRYLDDRASVSFLAPAKGRPTAEGDGIGRYLASLGFQPAFVSLAVRGDGGARGSVTHATARGMGVDIADPGTLYDGAFAAAATPAPASFEPDEPRLLQVRDGRALLDMGGLEVWVRPGTRLPGGLVVEAVNPREVRIAWPGAGTRRIRAAG